MTVQQEGECDENAEEKFQGMFNAQTNHYTKKLFESGAPKGTQRGMFKKTLGMALYSISPLF